LVIEYPLQFLMTAIDADVDAVTQTQRQGEDPDTPGILKSRKDFAACGFRCPGAQNQRRESGNHG
jgi:hypothetical protein